MTLPLIIIAIACIVLGTFAYAGLRGAPWVPTKKADVERFLKLAEIQPGQKMVDLGCGDGRLVCAAANAGAEAQGYELSLIPYGLAKVRRLFQPGRRSISIHYRDAWKADLSDVDVVYFFLMRSVYPKLKEKLESELRPGSKVIAYVWPVEGWEPFAVDEVEGFPKMYLYRIGR